MDDEPYNLMALKVVIDAADKRVKDMIDEVTNGVCVGAFLSTMDAATDVYVIMTYYKNGLIGRAVALLLMLGLNMGAQLLMCYGQNLKQTWSFF